MQGPLRISDDVIVPAAELSWRFSRSSGPGGQHVNTSDTRVELSINVAMTTALSETQRARALDRLGTRAVDGVVTVVATEHRSQLRNREAATERMAELIRTAIAPPPRKRRPTKPSRRAQQKRLDAKRRRSDLKRMRRGEN